MTQPTHDELIAIIANLKRGLRERDEYIQQLEQLVGELKAQRRDTGLDDLTDRLRFRK